MNERNSDAAASNSPGEPLYRSQLSTRWAAKMLPPETEVMWVIRGRMPRVAEQADQAEVIQARPEAAAGEGKTDSQHGLFSKYRLVRSGKSDDTRLGE